MRSLCRHKKTAGELGSAAVLIKSGPYSTEPGLVIGAPAFALELVMAAVRLDFLISGRIEASIALSSTSTKLDSTDLGLAIGAEMDFLGLVTLTVCFAATLAGAFSATITSVENYMDTHIK